MVNVRTREAIGEFGTPVDEELLRRVRVHKHGDHDQSTHGNWATGASTATAPEIHSSVVSAAKVVPDAVAEYGQRSIRLGAHMAAAQAQLNANVLLPALVNARPHSVSDEFRDEVQASTTALHENPAITELFDRFGAPTVVTGARFFDGAPPGATMAANASGVIVVFETGMDDYMAAEEEAPRLLVGNTAEWAGQDGNIRHEYGHMVSDLLMDETRPGHPDYAGGRSGSQVAAEWQQVAGPFYGMDALAQEPPDLTDAGPVALVSYYGAADPWEAFSEVFTLVTSPRYEERKRFLPAEVRRVADWVEEVIR